MSKEGFTFWKHRDWTGPIKTVTIKRDNVGDYYLMLACEDAVSTEPLPLTGNVAGIDFGLKTFLNISDGIKIESPQFFKQSIDALRSAHKLLSRKQFLSGVGIERSVILHIAIKMLPTGGVIGFGKRL